MRIGAQQQGLSVSSIMKFAGASAVIAMLATSAAHAVRLLSEAQARAKAIAVLRGDPYGKTNAEVASHIKEVKQLPDGKTTPCPAIKKPVWQFHVVVTSPDRKIDGYLVLDARSGKMLCANLPLLD